MAYGASNPSVVQTACVQCAAASEGHEPWTSHLEVLRLVVLDGVMEMRFCGARVRLGPLMT